jgi:hypothetical protein
MCSGAICGHVPNACAQLHTNRCGKGLLVVFTLLTVRKCAQVDIVLASSAADTQTQ